MPKKPIHYQDHKVYIIVIEQIQWYLLKIKSNPKKGNHNQLLVMVVKIL